MARCIITVDLPWPGEPYRRVYVVCDGNLEPVRHAHSEADVITIAGEYDVPLSAVAWVQHRRFPAQ